MNTIRYGVSIFAVVQNPPHKTAKSIGEYFDAEYVQHRENRKKHVFTEMLYFRAITSGCRTKILGRLLNFFCKCTKATFPFETIVILSVFRFGFLVWCSPICVALHIYHHTVIQHRIEKYSKHTAYCTQNCIRVAAS